MVLSRQVRADLQVVQSSTQCGTEAEYFCCCGIEHIAAVPLHQTHLHMCSVMPAVEADCSGT